MSDPTVTPDASARQEPTTFRRMTAVGQRYRIVERLDPDGA